MPKFLLTLAAEEIAIRSRAKGTHEDEKIP